MSEHLSSNERREPKWLREQRIRTLHRLEAELSQRLEEVKRENCRHEWKDASKTSYGMEVCVHCGAWREKR